ASRTRSCPNTDPPPSVGRSAVASRRSSVVLPEAFGPTTSSTECGGSTNVTSRTAHSRENCRLRPCALTAGRDSRSSCIRASAAGHRPYDQKGFPPRRDRVREGSVRRLVGEILLAGKEPYQWTPLLRGGITDRPAQHWILCLQRVEDRALRRRALNLERHLSADARQRPKMLRKHDVDHVRLVRVHIDHESKVSRQISADLLPGLAGIVAAHHIPVLLHEQRAWA